jgi:hypothetical protein
LSDNQLTVPSAEKLTLLKKLLDMPQLTDIQIKAPMLPEIYQHFAGKTKIGSQHDA